MSPKCRRGVLVFLRGGKDGLVSPRDGGGQKGGTERKWSSKGGGSIADPGFLGGGALVGSALGCWLRDRVRTTLSRLWPAGWFGLPTRRYNRSGITPAARVRRVPPAHDETMCVGGRLIPCFITEQ